MGERVAVIGCGLMGSAVACTLATGNCDVVVWNRTPEKALALAGPRLTAASSAAEAVSSASLVLVVVSTYQAACQALESVDGWGGKTLASLVTGTPADAESLGAWARDRGAKYIDGAILAYPQDIGASDAMVVFSGPAGVWGRHEKTLRLLGGASRLVSDQLTAANVLDVAATGAFYTVAFGAFVEAAAYAAAWDVPAGALLTPAESLLDLLRRNLPAAAEAIDADEHTTDQATLDVHLEASEAWLEAMVSVGQRARLLAAAVECLRAAHAEGHGRLGFSAQVKTALQR